MVSLVQPYMSMVPKGEELTLAGVSVISTALISRPAEEGPRSTGIGVDVGPAIDIVRKAHATTGVAATAPGEIRVTPGIDVGCPRGGRNLLGVVSLVIVGLGLQHAHQHVAGPLEIELIEPPMLAAQTVKPCPLGAFDERTSFASDLYTLSTGSMGDSRFT